MARNRPQRSFRTASQQPAPGDMLPPGTAGVGREAGESHARTKGNPSPPGGRGGRHRQRARMVRFRGLRLSGRRHRQELLSIRQRGHAAARGLRGVRRRFRGSAARRHRDRMDRRSERPESLAAADHFRDGGRHGADRHRSELRQHRGAGAHADRARPADAGLLRRRRMGRLDRVHRRMGALGSPRILRQLPTEQRGGRPPARLRRCRADQHALVRRRRRELGLAHSVPARRTDPAGRHLHAPPHRRDAGLSPQPGGRRTGRSDFAAAARRTRVRLHDPVDPAGAPRVHRVRVRGGVEQGRPGRRCRK